MCKEIAKELRNKLKEIGYNRTLVAVKSTDYDTQVIIKSDVVDYIEVDSIVKEYNSRNIIISFEENLKEGLFDSYKEIAEKIFNTRNELNATSVFAEDENYKLLYDYKFEQLFLQDKKANCSFPKMIEKYNVNDLNNIKYRLIDIHLKYKMFF